jgi:hypothetical protein
MGWFRVRARFFELAKLSLTRNFFPTVYLFSGSSVAGRGAMLRKFAQLLAGTAVAHLISRRKEKEWRSLKA